MKMKKSIALVLTLIFAACFAMTGCGKSSGTSSTMDKEQSINVAAIADVRSLDLNKATDAYSHNVLWETYEGLTRIENDGKQDKIAPAGAEKWETSSDGLVWTFHLRDFNWADGKPVTAKDFVYSWRRLLNPKTASQYAAFAYCVKGAQAYNEGKGQAEDVGVKAVDDKTFEVTLEYAVPYFINLTAFSNLYPLRQDSVEAGGEKYGQDPAGIIGNGPFVISEWIKGSKTVLKKNDKYWDAKSVKLQTVTINVVKEDAPRMQMFSNKQIDTVLAKAEYKDKFSELAKKGEVVMTSSYDPSEAYEFFNVGDKSKLFSNKKIRLAFSLAIDREAWVKTVMKSGTPAYGWTAFEIICGDKQYRKAVGEEPLKAVKDQDPKKLFQEGLTELGMDPNGVYEIQYLSSGTDTTDRSAAEFLQNQWQNKLGVKVKLEACNDFPQFCDRVDRLEYQIAGMSWGADYNEPMTFFDMFTTGNGNNPGKWSNAKYDELVKQAANEIDPNKRIELYKQCEKILVADDAGIAPTYYRMRDRFTQKYVKGLQNPMMGPDWEFKYAYIEGKE